MEDVSQGGGQVGRAGGRGAFSSSHEREGWALEEPVKVPAGMRYRDRRARNTPKDWRRSHRAPAVALLGS